VNRFGINAWPRYKVRLDHGSAFVPLRHRQIQPYTSAFNLLIAAYAGRFDTLRLRLLNLHPSSASVIPFLRISINGGLSYDAGGTNYVTMFSNTAPAAATSSGTLFDAELTNSANSLSSLEIDFPMFGGKQTVQYMNQLYQKPRWIFRSYNSEAKYLSGMGYWAGVGRIDAIQIATASNAMQFDWDLIGIR